ncbi:MAG: flavin reductase family protein [Candidatus Margulisiibacteriota bacterium]
MSKAVWKPGTMIYPLPAVMVTCGTYEGGGDTSKSNIITLAWVGTICSEPAMCSISVRPSRYSHDIIRKNNEFVVNLTTKDLVFEMDYCGVKSGRDMDKFKKLKLTPLRAKMVKAPLIKESPVNIECRVEEIKKLGSHDLFIAKVLCIHADDKYMDKTGKFDLEKAGLICYSHGQYYCLGKKLGHFGFSVRKRK